MSSRIAERTALRLRVLLFALLLSIAAGIAPVALTEMTALALLPNAAACGSQSGGC